MSKVYIKKNSQYTEVSDFFMKVNGEWSGITQADFLTYARGTVATFGGVAGPRIGLSIAAPRFLTGETCQCFLLADGEEVITGVTWDVVSGSTYASIDTGGTLTIGSTANGSRIVLGATYSGESAQQEMFVTYLSGSTSHTTTETETDSSGNTITTNTTVTENEDGTQTTQTTSTKYNSNGDPVEQVNEGTDTDGNVSTQEIEFDESGNSVVTAYTIDTSNNPDGNKEYNGDGVNTEFYAFDVTRGFVLHIHFYMDFTQQPAGQDENHHNILTMKRANPSPWYGFQIRQTSTNKYIQLGTQFSTGSNTNTQIASAATASANTAEYDLTITYNPTASTNAFVCRNNLTSSNVYTSNNKFPDIDDLKYLKTTIGYAMDANGDPFRYSNIRVVDFDLRKT